MSSENLLSPRFRNDGTSVVNLDQGQSRTRTQVQNKIEAGEYTFEKTPCPICTHGGTEQLSEKDRYGLSHFVVICTLCGLIRTTPRMTEKSFASFYDKEYRSLYESYDDWKRGRFENQLQRAESVKAYLTDQLGDIDGSSIVDIGCGPGGMLSYFQSEGHEVAGCDLDSQATDYGRSQGIPITHGTVSDLELEWSPDIVILSHVVEHFLEPVQALKEIQSLIHSDSRLYVEVPGVNWLSPRRTYYQADFLRQLQNAHTYYFTAQSLTNLFSSAGYSPLSVNEEIRSIFRPSNDMEPKIHSDYKDTRKHLERLERYRKYNLHNIGQLRNVHRHPTVISGLKRSGLYPMAKRIQDIF